MTDKEVIETLCKIQDINKMFKRNSKDEEQIKHCDNLEKLIQAQFEKLYIN